MKLGVASKSNNNNHNISPTQIPAIKKTNMKKSPNGEQWKTRILPPPLQNSILLNEIKVPEKKTQNLSSTTSLYELLPLRIKKSSDLSRARVLLKHFEKNGNITWDSFGDIFSPINNYNIIDIINDLINKSDKIEKKRLDDYKHFISIANIPTWLIKNETILNAIKRDPPPSPPPTLPHTSLQGVIPKFTIHKKKGGGRQIKKIKLEKNKWMCY